MKDAAKSDTHRNPHDDAGREASQPYATEQEDYGQGPTRPPQERPGRLEADRRKPPEKPAR